MHVFLLASVAAHAAAIIGLPGFLPEFAPPGSSVLEVTILAPRPVPAPAAQPEPAQARPPEEPKAVQPRPEPEKKTFPQTAKPRGGVTAPAASSPPRDPEGADSISVGSSREIAPLATVPVPAAEAPARQVKPPIFDAAYLNNPAPPYPPAAVRAGQQGTVMLRVMVRRDGLPSRVEIDKSSGSRALDTAAQDAVWSWRFEPARHGTDPIESWVMVPVVFRLKDPQ